MHFGQKKKPFFILIIRRNKRKEAFDYIYSNANFSLESSTREKAWDWLRVAELFSQIIMHGTIVTYNKFSKEFNCRKENNSIEINQYQ